jgi:hypothetical protein
MVGGMHSKGEKKGTQRGPRVASDLFCSGWELLSFLGAKRLVM